MKPAATRRHIIELLQTIASELLQLQYERTVSIADVPAELLSMWFDDLYHTALVEQQFTANEAAALARFHALFDEEYHKLPQHPGTIEIWLDDPAWRKIMSAAEETLEQIEPKTKNLRG